MRVPAPRKLPWFPRIVVLPSDILGGPPSNIETPTPKDDGGHQFILMSPLGNELARAASVPAAVGVAEAFGSGTEIWYHGQRVGTYERGREGTGGLPRSVVRGRLREGVAFAVRRIERSERDYIERVRAAHPPLPVEDSSPPAQQRAA